MYNKNKIKVDINDLYPTITPVKPQIDMDREILIEFKKYLSISSKSSFTVEELLIKLSMIEYESYKKRNVFIIKESE